MGSWDGEDVRQGSGWQTMWSHICMQINWEEQLGSKTDHTTQGSSMGNYSLKTSGYKNLCRGWQPEKLPALQESLLDGSMGPRTYTSPTTQESVLEGPNLLVGSGGSEWKWGKSSARGIVPTQTTPLTHSTTVQRSGLLCPGKYLRLHPLQHNRCTQSEKCFPNERTNQNSRKRTKQRGDRQPIRCRVQNTSNQDAHRNDWVWSQK